MFLKDFFWFSLKQNKIKLLHSLQISHLQCSKTNKMFFEWKGYKMSSQTTSAQKEGILLSIWICLIISNGKMSPSRLKGQVLFFCCWWSCIFLNIGDHNGKCWQNHQWSASIQEVICNLKATILPWLFWMPPPLSLTNTRRKTVCCGIFNSKWPEIT